MIGCLTPKGQQFSTIRGRPITGLEAIALQGLPIDTLLLTRESQKELIDLGGNAMTSTVVGAALIAALTVSHTVLTRPKVSRSQPLHNLSRASDGMTFTELEDQQVMTFDCSDNLSLSKLCEMANQTIRLCHCEGQTLTVSASIRTCSLCGHHCCEKCGNVPKHDYKLVGENGAPLRTGPQEFRRFCEQVLPTRLVIEGFSEKTLDTLSKLVPNKAEEYWTIYSQAILFACNQEFRYKSMKRTHCWTITYQAPSARLVLVIIEKDVYWLLYGEADQSEPGNSATRKLLESPLARLTVQGQKMRGGICTGQNVLEGCWEIRLPIDQTFSILVEPRGDLKDSWEKKLGLQGARFIDKQVWTSLHISLTPESAAPPILDHDIRGDYDLLADCGTACGTLHKKRPTHDSNEPPFYLFLESDRNGHPDHDSYVFSTDIHQLEFGENRYVSATVDNKWRTPSKSSDLDIATSTKVSCTVSSRWEACSLTLRPYQGSEEASSRFPKRNMSMPVFGTNHAKSHASADDLYGCLHEDARTALVSCEIPGELAGGAGWQVGHWTVMDQRSGRQIAAAFAWLFARVKDLKGFRHDWRPLDSHPNGFQNCPVCAPKPPRIMWTCSRTGKNDKIIPYEDGREAGEYERNIKARPSPFIVQTRVDDDERRAGRLQIGLHLPTLVHRALAQIGNISDHDGTEGQWRLDTQWEPPTSYRLKEFELTNNKLGLEADYAFPTGQVLRPEQKRSLHWMIGQEADDMKFEEEEIEEAVLPQLGWRAEVRIRRKRIVRGGVQADEVGYGKTATTLALVDARAESAERYPDYHAERQAQLEVSGCIPVKATLILVPPHLINQWKGQILKFLGLTSDDDRILIIENYTNLTGVSIKQIRTAVIVLTSWAVLISPAYMTQMSRFAALPAGPTSGAREIEAWLTRACENIEKHTGELASKDKSPKNFAKVLKQRLKEAHNDETILRDIPTTRLKGAKYTSYTPADGVTPVVPCPDDEELDTFFKHMTNSKCKDSDSVTSNLLHMFDFYRVVVDEYTYIEDGQRDGLLSSLITSIKAYSRWVLSGTPNIQDFGDVQKLARFLACNLGIVDDAAGVIRGATIRNIRDNRTAAEQFRAFGFSHTAAWHINRQAHAQKFLDQYASKNIPEIDHIKSVPSVRPHLLGATETICNAELQQQLESTNMNIILQGKSKKENDRARRVQELLLGCKSAPECLIKSCLWFQTGDAQSAGEVSEDAMDVDDQDGFQSRVDALIDVRDKQWEKLIEELKHHLLHAEWLEQQCQRAPRPDPQGSHYSRWRSEIEHFGLHDPYATEQIKSYITLASAHLDANTEEIYYRDPPPPEDLETEKKDAEARKKREKAKRLADKKKKVGGNHKRRKISKTSRATADEDSKDPVAIDNERDDAGPAPKPIKIQADDFAMFNSECRAVTAHLRGLAAEMVSRARSSRFAQSAKEMLEWLTSKKEEPSCDCCGKPTSADDGINVNIYCGHAIRDECLNKRGTAVCAADGCKAGAERYRLRKAVDVAGDGIDYGYGARVNQIVELINSLPEDEQVLLFIQFEDVMSEMAEVLEKAKIPNYALVKNAGRVGNERLTDFQDNETSKKKKVLLLNPLSETASGM